MEIAIRIIVALVALTHVFILWFEMFAWETKGPKIFRGFSKELFSQTTAMAANQGLYNGFLAVGLIWTFFIKDLVWRDHITLFFLICVSVAGIYGSLTVEKKILFSQGIPAIIGVILLTITSYL